MLKSATRERLKYEISRQVREAIMSRGITVAEAAQDLGISRQSLSQLLTARTLPSMDVLARMVSKWNLDLRISDMSIRPRDLYTRNGTPEQEILLHEQRLEQVVSELPQHLQVFLCHASEDRDKIRKLYTQLHDDGFLPWLDTENLLPGENWAQAINAAISKSDVVLVCLSSQAVQKTGYAQKEIARALDAAEERPEATIYIVPVLLERCPIPDRIKKWQAVDLSEGAGYARLLLALKRRAEQLGYDVTKLDRKIRTKVIERFAKSGSYRSAEENARELRKYEPFSKQEMDRILEAAEDNGQIWNAAAIPEILEDLIAKYGRLVAPKISKKYREALKRR